jgi:hypothetical protein
LDCALRRSALPVSPWAILLVTLQLKRPHYFFLWTDDLNEDFARLASWVTSHFEPREPLNEIPSHLAVATS